MPRIVNAKNAATENVVGTDRVNAVEMVSAVATAKQDAAARENAAGTEDADEAEKPVVVVRANVVETVDDAPLKAVAVVKVVVSEAAPADAVVSDLHRIRSSWHSIRTATERFPQKKSKMPWRHLRSSTRTATENSVMKKPVRHSVVVAELQAVAVLKVDAAVRAAALAADRVVVAVSLRNACCLRLTRTRTES